MSNSIYYNGQYVNANDLNNTEAQRIVDIKSRGQLGLTTSGGYQHGSASIVQGGIYGSQADYLDGGKNFYPTLLSSYGISIARGDAIDINGELIQLAEQKSLLFGESDENYTWATGSVNQMNYIKIAYQESSGSFIFDPVLQIAIPHRYTSSYYITVNNVPPVSTDVLIGTFLTSSIGTIEGTIADRRLYVRPIVPSEGVYVNTTTNPIPVNTTFYHHEQSVGSGTPSNSNPHGLLYSDVGAAPSGTVLTLSNLNATAYDIGTVYQNTSSSVWLSAEGAVFYYDEPGTSQNSIDLALRIGSSGSAGPAGSLSGTIYTAAQAYQQVVTPNLYGDQLRRKVSIRGFIPSGYFFVFDSINGGGWFDPTHSYSIKTE